MILVDSTADDLGAPNGNCTLREAVLSANQNVGVDDCEAGEASPVRDVIVVPFPGVTLTLSGDEDAALTGDLDLLDDVEIVGQPSSGLLPLVSKTTGDRIFQVHAGVTALIDSLELRDGDAADGGCLHVGNGAILVLVDSIVRSCTATGRGGGLWAGFATVTIERSEFRGNGSSTEGGGLAFNDVAGTIDDSAFVDNVSLTSGGGLFGIGSGSTIVRNTTVSDNDATVFGGGIYWFSGTLHLRNATIARNQADLGGGDPDEGGGVAVAAGAVVNARNSLIAENTDQGNDPDCAGSINSEGFNLIGVDSAGCSIGGELEGVQTDVDAMLGELVVDGWTRMHPLLAGSPAIDAGSTTAIGFGFGAGPTVPGIVGAFFPCESHDQRGVARPKDGDEAGGARCDIGAYEVDPGPFSDGFELGSTIRWSQTVG